MEYYRTTELYHYGLKGMKWGIRRFQNSDGTFNEAGKARYFSRGSGENYKKIGKSGGGVSGGLRNKLAAKVYGVNERYYAKRGNNAMAAANRKAKEAQLKKYDSKNTPEARAARAAKLKKAAKIGATVAAAGLLAYGGYKLYSSNQANKALKQMISDEQARERRKKGEQALARMYDKMAMEAMQKGATYYSFTDNNIGYNIELGKKRK